MITKGLNFLSFNQKSYIAATNRHRMPHKNVKKPRQIKWGLWIKANIENTAPKSAIMSGHDSFFISTNFSINFSII